MSQFPLFNNHETKQVSNGAVVTFDLPRYGTVDDVVLRFNNNGVPSTDADIRAGVQRITVIHNGNNIVDAPASEIKDFYKSLGNRAGQNKPENVINLNPGAELFDDPQARDFYAWGMADVQSFQVRVTMNATITGITDINCGSWRRDFASNRGSAIRMISYAQTLNSAGEHSVTSLPQDPRQAYLNLLVFPKGGTITHGECLLDTKKIIDKTTIQELDYHAASVRMGVVPGVLQYLFADGTLNAMLPMETLENAGAGKYVRKVTTDLRLRNTFSAPPSDGEYDVLAVDIVDLQDSVFLSVMTP